MTDLLADDGPPTSGHWASEDELDWLENQARPLREARSLDAALIGIAVTLTAAVVAITLGLLKLF